MESNLTLAALTSQLLVGLSRAMILFIVSSGLSFILGVLRVPNVAHGSLYMIGAFAAHTIATAFGESVAGFWLAMFCAPLIVAVVSLVAERLLFCHLYEREHLMLLLFTFALMLILGDLTKMTWGADSRATIFFCSWSGRWWRWACGCFRPGPSSARSPGRRRWIGRWWGPSAST